MNIKTTSKVVAAVVGFSMTLTAFAAVGSTLASAQSMSLAQLINVLVAAGIIPADKAAAAQAAVAGTATSYSFTKDLTVGSTGADVTALQNAIGVTPATGYFGSITKAAVIAFQKAHAVPGTGYVGPLTRAALNGSATASTGTTATTGSTSTTGSTPVVNSGVEGILTADLGSLSNINLYEGQTMVPVVNIKLQAKLSDINVQRVQLNLGSNTTVYTKVFKTMYLVDDSGKVLAQADLNSNTVVKSGSDYLLTFSGFSYTVAKDSTKYLTVKADLYSSIKANTAACEGTGSTCTITVPQNGVRGTDGAGIDQYAPATAFSQNTTISSSLTDSAQLLLSTDAANFLSSDVVAADGAANNQYDKLPLLAFDVRAQKDTVEITDLNATITKTAGNATATAAYLYDGSTLIGSASVDAHTGVAKFTNINYWVPQDTTKVLTLKADISSADASVSTLSATVASTDPSAQNSQGSTVTPTGSAAGNSFNIRNAGPVFVLNSATISQTTSAAQGNYSTTTDKATFNLTIRAVGGDVYVGTPGNVGSSFTFGIYQNGSLATLAVASSTAASNPSTGAVTTGLNGSSFKIAQNNFVTLPVTFSFDTRKADGSLLSSTNSYAAGLESITWYSADGAGTSTSNFMKGQTAWRTSAI